MTTSAEALFSTVLVANRGEIACRVISALQRLGITAVAVYSEADADAAHVRAADHAVCIGPAPAAESYLSIEAVIAAAQRTGAEAVHPGYGFMSENVAFARACESAGLVFIGPGPEALEVMGDKIRSKNHVAAAGVPVIDGVSEPGLTDQELIASGRDMAFPLLIKPSAGGGGKGMHVVERPEDLPEAVSTARRVAQAAFGDGTLFIEQLIRSPRHIEVQILADHHGAVVHLGERECSLQRRHQKVVEEAPSPLLASATRERIGEAACATARSVNYRGAGTVEFLVSDLDPETFYFMEMNTRLQVEHPVTEQVTGVDLVEQQIRIAADQQLSMTQQSIRLTGHSVEARVYAEVPEAGFLPSTGTVLSLQEPQAEGVRVDSGLRVGSVIGTDYDPMLAKIITTGDNREQAMARLDRALANTVVLGVETNIAFLRQLITHDDVRAGRMDTTLIDRLLPELRFPRPDEDVAHAAALFAAAAKASRAQRFTGSEQQAWAADGWRLAEPVPAQHQVSHRGPDGHTTTVHVTLDGTTELLAPEAAGRPHIYRTPTTSQPMVLAAGRTAPEGAEVWVWSAGFCGMVTVADRQAQTLQQLAQIEAESEPAAPEVAAPLPGTVVAVHVCQGADVAAGDALLTVEAMKMEHRLLAPSAGVVTLAAAQGDTVKLGQVLATVEPQAAAEPAEEPAAQPLRPDTK